MRIWLLSRAGWGRFPLRVWRLQGEAVAAPNCAPRTESEPSNRTILRLARRVARGPPGAQLVAPDPALAVSIHLPFVIGLLCDRPPGWIDSAWQVSATLVGLGVAVVVFLLQAGLQSLSSDATYRSLLAYSLARLAGGPGGGLLARRSGHRTPGGVTGTASGWADTGLLVVFGAQVVGFGISFARTAQSRRRPGFDGCRAVLSRLHAGGGTGRHSSAV